LEARELQIIKRLNILARADPSSTSRLIKLLHKHKRVVAATNSKMQKVELSANSGTLEGGAPDVSLSFGSWSDIARSQS